MYDDDTHLTYAGENPDNIQLHLNQDLENVLNWLIANKLTLNLTKPEFMLLESRQRLSTLTETPTLAINDFQVSQVTITKSLGVTIDDKLDWSGYVVKVTKKVASDLTSRILYQALIEPHFDCRNRIVLGQTVGQPHEISCKIYKIQ